MKILHTGDWHIGKLVHGVHMTEDQKHILEQFVDWVRINEPDVIIIAGDLYDRSVPPTEAIELLSQVLSELVIDLKVTVIAITGNHDSSERVSFLGGILEKQGLYIRHNLDKVSDPIILKDDVGEVHFYPIPYMDYQKINHLYPEDNITDFEEAYKVILSQIEEAKDDSVRNICIAHGYMISGNSVEVSDSVRPLSIGGSEYVDISYFKGFDYVALGHLHRPQRVGYDHIRYAGSLMKYSFSEAMQNKSMTYLEIDKDGKITTEDVTFKPLKDMRIIKGKLSELIQEEVYGLENTEDYIKAVLTDKTLLYEPMSSLRQVYPNVLQMVYERDQKEDHHVLNLQQFEEKSAYDLFTEFYENMEGETLSTEADTSLKAVIDAVLKER